MNRLAIIAAFFALLFLIEQSAPAQSGYDLFQKGLVKERTEGDLDEAIRLYERIVAEHKDDRTLVAKALVQMGQCYEKLGRAEARKAYERVINEYADQNEAVAQARTRLVAIERDNGKSEVTVRKIWGAYGSEKEIEDENIHLYWLTWDNDSSISPDGRYIAYTNWGPPSIGVYDLTTGESRDITDEGTWSEPPTGDEFGYHSIWSPDGRYVAYTWCIQGAKAANLKDHYELRVSGLDGAKPRILHSTDSSEEWIGPHDWSPDGKTILATIERGKQEGIRGISLRQIVLISVEGGSKHVLKTFEHDMRSYLSGGCRMFFSPDGRYIAYDLEQSDDLTKHDIHLLEIDGSGDSIPLVKHPADDQVLGWAPDGKRLLFATDRTGEETMVSIEVHEAQARGIPQSIRRLETGFRPIGLTRDGAFYYGVRIDTRDVYTATLDLNTGDVIVPPTLVNAPIESHAALPCWSSDGQYLAYLSPSAGNEKISITIRSVKTNEVRVVEHSNKIKRMYPRFFEWSPNGKSFLIPGVPHQPFTELRAGGLYEMDAQTGDVSLITHATDANEILFLATWSPDGRSVFYQRARWNSSYWVRSVRILERNLETGKEREIAKDVDFGPFELPRHFADFSLSPDGQRIAFISLDARDKDGPRYCFLNVKPLAGGEATELFRMEEKSITLQGWTPDGRYILFQDHENFGPSDKKNLWRIPATGGEPRKIELTMKEINHLRVHPNGRQVAFDVTGIKLELWAMEEFLSAPTSALTPAGAEDLQHPFGLDIEVPDPESAEIKEFAAKAKLSGDDSDWNAPQWCNKIAAGKRGSLDGLWEGRWISDIPGDGSRREIVRVKTVDNWVYILCGENEDKLIKVRRQGNRLVGGWTGFVGPGSKSRPWIGLIVNDERIDGAWTDGSASGRWDFRRNLLPAVELASPASDSHVAIGKPVLLQADVTVAEGVSVHRVEFLIDGAPVGDDTEPPYQFSWDRTKQGRHWASAKVYDSAGGTELSLPVNVMVGGLQKSIACSEDDAEEVTKNGSMLLDTKYLDLLGGDNMVVALRFTDIRIPRGARIKHAYLQFTVPAHLRYRSSEKTDLALHAELAANAEPFTKVNHNITSRSKTTASVEWSPEPWTEGEWPSTQWTPDLVRLVQEVVNQPEWKEGGALVLIISGSGWRQVESWDAGGSGAPMLYIDY